MNNNLKSQLRQEYLTKLKNLDAKTKKQWDQEILQKFIKSNEFKNHQVFALYWSLSHEVDTHQIIKILLENNKKVCLPRMKDQQLTFYYINDVTELKIDNKFNIAQPPVTNESVNLQAIEVFLIPLVAFDQKNNRLGYGGGFYDRFLSQKVSNLTIGLAYKIQLIANKNYHSESWDIPLFKILTNN